MSFPLAIFILSHIVQYVKFFFVKASKYNLTSGINSDIIIHVGHKTGLCCCTGFISNKSERYDCNGRIFRRSKQDRCSI